MNIKLFHIFYLKLLKLVVFKNNNEYYRNMETAQDVLSNYNLVFQTCSFSCNLCSVPVNDREKRCSILFSCQKICIECHTSLVIKCFGITNTSVQNFVIWISSVQTVPKCLRKIKVFFSKFNIDVWSLLMSSLRAIVICQKYFGNHVISSKIHLFAPLLNTRHCTLCVWKRCEQIT